VVINLERDNDTWTSDVLLQLVMVTAMQHVLRKEFCYARAPKMMLDLHSDGSHLVDRN
jgi:hypothetical protein